MRSAVEGTQLKVSLAGNVGHLTLLHKNVKETGSK